MSTGREANAQKFFGKLAEASKELYALDYQKNVKKNLLSYPSNTYEDSLKQQITTCPAFVIQDFGMYLTMSDLPGYVKEWFSDNEKYRYRDGVILEKDGEWFPESAPKIPDPGQPLTTPKAYYSSVYSEKHGEETFWLSTLIDYHKFDYAERYYEFEHYWRLLDSIFAKMSNADARFIIQYVHAWIYGVTSKAVWFEISSDDQIMWAPTGKDINPEETFSKLASQYFKADGEIKKRLKQIAGWAEQKHKNRVLYDPIHLSKSMGLPAPNIEDAEYTQELKTPDLSEQSKVKQYIKDTYFSKFEQGKTVSSTMGRGASLIALGQTILHTVKKFTGFSALQTNTFNYQIGESAKDANAQKKADVIKTRCRASDLVILMNTYDKIEMESLTVGEVTPLNSNSITAKNTLDHIKSLGVTIHDCPILLPGWAIVCERQAFKLYRYFKGIYQEQHWWYLIESHIGHSMFRPVVFSNVCGAAILPATKNSFTAPMSFYSTVSTFGILKDN